MFDGMELSEFSNDGLEQLLTETEHRIGQGRALQMAVLAEVDVRQMAAADGARSLSEWVTGRLDVSPDTAKSLVQTMRRLQERPDLEDRLAAGETTFDRVEAVSRIPEDVGLLECTDVAGVHREAAQRIRVTARDEVRSADDRYLVLQPNLDETSWRMWGGFDGHSGALIEKVLTETADQLPDLPGGENPGLGWRKATAMVAALVSDNPPPATVSVIVDTKHATPTQAEAGVVLESGTRVGRRALQAVLCDAVVEVVARTETGRYLDYGRRQRTAPPTLKRALLAKYGYQCGADGCQNRYRLQIHHRIPWSQGGETNQDELVVLCWYHHQIIVHEKGYQIIHHRTGRIRFSRPHPARPPPVSS
jgi:hypothetical protein